jgi:hypothetical protein
MKFALDTEFVDTPQYSECISLALVAEDGRDLYVEFDCPKAAITPWLQQHVVPMLSGETVSFRTAASMIRNFVGGSRFEQPEFWAYYAAYDWYWFCRVFGGFMELPDFYPHLVRDFAYIQQGVPNISGPEHFALNDARSLMHAMRKRGITTVSNGVKHE